MSMDFITALAGPDATLSALVPAIDHGLLGSGFVLGSTVVKAGLDSSRDVFDETEFELRGVRSLSQIGRQVAGWPGVALEYRREDLGTLYILVGRTVGRHLNVWIEIGERTFRDACRSGRQEALYTGVGVIANACGSLVGLGDLEQERQPQSPKQLTDRLVRDIGRADVSPGRLYVFRRGESEKALDAIRLQDGTRLFWSENVGFLETKSFREFWLR